MSTKDFVDGAIIGVAQTLIGHPFDTFKSLIQVNKCTKQIPPLKTLYRGVHLPIFFSGIFNSLQFGIFDSIKNSCGIPLASFIAGGISSVVVAPHDFVKLNLQTNRKDNIKFKNFYRGFILTSLRESMAVSMYFTSYFYMMNSFNKEYKSPFWIGGFAGCLSWLLTYPIDTIKTRYQVNVDSTVFECMKYRNVWAGFSYCMMRAFLVNGMSFFIYDKLK